MRKNEILQRESQTVEYCMMEGAVRFICGSGKPGCFILALQSDGGCAILYLFIEAAVHSCIKFYIREDSRFVKGVLSGRSVTGEHKSSESKSTGKIG